MTVQAETTECMEWPLSMPYSNDLQTWFPLLDAQLTATDDIFEVGRLEGAALLEPPSQEQLDSFHAPSDHELMSYLLKRKRLVIALGKAAVRIEQLKDLCNRYEGLPKIQRARSEEAETRSTAGSGMSREQLTSVLQSMTQSQAVEGLSSDPQHLFSAAQAIETLVCSLRDLATQYERDRSQLEASIHLCTCAGSITRLLPDELLLKIFSYLSGTSQKARPFVDCIDGSTMPKIAAALTCRRWKHIIFNYPELWSSLRVDCSSFQYAKLKALPTTIPGLDRHIARAKMSMKMDIELIAWDAPQKPDLEDSKLLKAQVKLLAPLPMILMANWSTLTIRAQHISALLNLRLFQPWTFPNLTNLTIIRHATSDRIGDGIHNALWAFPRLVSLSLLGLLAGEQGFGVYDRSVLDPCAKPLANIQTLVVRGPSACQTTFSYLSHLPFLHSLVVEGDHNCNRIQVPWMQVTPLPVKLARLDTLTIGCQLTRDALLNLLCPSLRCLTIWTTEESSCRNLICNTKEDCHLLPEDHSTIVNFVVRSNCASTLQVLTINHLIRPSLVLDLLPLLDNLHTLSVNFFMHRQWQRALDIVTWCNPTASLLKALTVGTDVPTYLPHLQCLSLRFDREPATYSGGLNMAHLYDFCRSRLKPLTGMQPVLNRVCIRDQIETHPDATLVLLRSWAKVNAPKLDFRIWFEDI